jgi:hypothetical protein
LRKAIVTGEGSQIQLLPTASISAVAALPRSVAKEMGIEAERAVVTNPVKSSSGRAAARLGCFLGLIVVLIFAVNAVITLGLRRIKTSAYGASNMIMEGKVNADIVITGSSRALVQYDPRTIEAVTGRSAFNLGRNGSQTDMQVAFLKAYLAHNRRPAVVIHNLDAFSFVTTQQIFEPVQYIPYLYDSSLYDPMLKIDRDTWKSRYIPLYGYVVEDMNFTWLDGVAGFFGWSPHEDYFLGFNPRHLYWTGDFESFKEANPQGVRFDIEPAGIEDLKNLVSICKQNGIQLIFVYSPEYKQMQQITSNRAEIFVEFHRIAETDSIPIWDYSNWQYNTDKQLFYNSQHLNADGAALFSEDLARRLEQFLAEQSGTAPREAIGAPKTSAKYPRPDAGNQSN